jgi:hypothetical protein
LAEPVELSEVFAGTATVSGAWCLVDELGLERFFELRQLLALWERALGGQPKTFSKLCIIVDTCFAARLGKIKAAHSMDGFKMV